MTDGEKAKIIDDMVVVVDTREKKNENILTFLEENGIVYVVRKLDTADYSAEFPNYPEFNERVLVEKKNSLDEICSNFTKHRDRFKREFERVGDREIHLVMENATWKKLLNGKYRSKLHPNALMASILTWSIRYNTKMWFTTKDETGEVIYNIIKYGYREILKNC